MKTALHTRQPLGRLSGLDPALESPQPNFFNRFNSTLISIILVGIILLYAHSIILPLLCGLLLANLLLPFIKLLAQKGMSRPMCILIPLSLAIAIGGILLFFLYNQVAHFLDDVPSLNERLSVLTGTGQHWIKENTHLTITQQNRYIDQTFEALKDAGPRLLAMTFFSLKEILTYIVLVPIYTFLILYYKGTIKSFLVGLFKNGSAEKIQEVLNESTTVSHHYVTGLLIETLLVFTLNLIGFSVLGIEYSFFLAFLAALLNLIPYLGILVASVLCMMTTALSTNNPGDVIWVGVILAVVHLYDNNFGVPLVVGNKVRINALVTIVGVLVGGTLCGAPGMFLAIPALAVMKIIFDKIPHLRPWGILLGDESSLKKEKLELLKQKNKASHAS